MWKYMHTHTHASIQRHACTYTVHAVTHIVSSAAHTVNLYQSITSGRVTSSTFLHLLPHCAAHTRTHALLSTSCTWSRWQSDDVCRGECVTRVGRHQHHFISLLKLVMWMWDETHLHSCRRDAGQKIHKIKVGASPRPQQWTESWTGHVASLPGVFLFLRCLEKKVIVIGIYFVMLAIWLSS